MICGKFYIHFIIIKQAILICSHSWELVFQIKMRVFPVKKCCSWPKLSPCTYKLMLYNITLWSRKCSMSLLSITVAASHMWLLSIWNAATATEELSFFIVFNVNNLKFKARGSHIGQCSHRAVLSTSVEVYGIKFLFSLTFPSAVKCFHFKKITSTSHYPLFFSCLPLLFLGTIFLSCILLTAQILRIVSLFNFLLTSEPVFCCHHYTKIALTETSVLPNPTDSFSALCLRATSSACNSFLSYLGLVNSCSLSKVIFPGKHF